MSQKFLDLAGLTAYDKKLKEWFKSGVVDITDDAIKALFVTVAEGPADNEIWYTTVDGEIATIVDNNLYEIDATSWTNATLLSNTYENGKGVMRFDTDITKISGNNCNGVFVPFFTSTNLKTLTLPNSLQIIGKYTFIKCYELQEIVFPEGLKSIARIDTNTEEPGAFGTITLNNIQNIIWNPINCSNEVGPIFYYSSGSPKYTITLGKSVETIPSYFLANQYQAKLSSIPVSVSYIGKRAFDLISTKEITYDGTQEQWNAITKDVNWNYDNWGDPIKVVHCIDGDITL